MGVFDLGDSNLDLLMAQDEEIAEQLDAERFAAEEAARTAEVADADPRGRRGDAAPGAADRRRGPARAARRQPPSTARITARAIGAALPPPEMSARSASASSTTTATATGAVAAPGGLAQEMNHAYGVPLVAHAVLRGAGLAADHHAGDRRVASRCRA